jgi:hypothetical protein
MSKAWFVGMAALGSLAAFTMRSRLTECRAASAAEAGQADPAAVRADVTLVRSPTVQAELGLDALQTAAVGKAVAEIDQPLWRLRDARDEQSTGRIQSLRNRFTSALNAALGPEQHHRLDQLRWRSKGLWALHDPEFAGRLAVTPSQKDKLSELVA